MFGGLSALRMSRFALRQCPRAVDLAGEPLPLAARPVEADALAWQVNRCPLRHCLRGVDVRGW